MFDEKPKGVWPYQHLMLLEERKYREILNTLAYSVGINDNIQKHLHEMLKIVFTSESYKYTRRLENLRLVPEFLNAQSLRVFSKGDNRDLTTVHEAYETVSYDFEKNNYARETPVRYNKDFALTYVFPQISGKYSLYANIKYLLQYEFILFERKIEVVNENSEEYDNLLKGILAGFLKHHAYDREDEAFLAHERERMKDLEQPVDIFEMEMFFMFLEAINWRLGKLGEIRDVTKEESTYLRENKKQSFTNMETAAEMEAYEKERRIKNEELHRLNQEEEAIIREIRLVLDKLIDVNLCPAPNEKEGNKVRVARDRYFKPLFPEKTEKEVYQDKYRKNVTNYMDLTQKEEYRDLEFIKNADPNQLRWLQQKDLYIYDIKKEDNRKLPDLYVDKVIVPSAIQERKIIMDRSMKMDYFKTIKK